MARIGTTGTADWLGPGLVDQVRNLSVHLKPHLPALERRLDQRLKKEGFDKLRRDALAAISPLAAAHLLLKRAPISKFFSRVESAGQELAKLNVMPNDVTRALKACDDIIDETGVDSEYNWPREQLTFCTILALNHAYYEVREAESRAFYELFQMEVESSNIDVLFRRFVEAMAASCGAAAGHVFLLADHGKHWRLAASTPQAVSSKTLAVTPAPSRVRNSLRKACRVQRAVSVLDAGWHRRFRAIWSIPFGRGDILQFGFSEERTLLPRELEMLAAAGDRCQAAAEKTRLLEEIAIREEQLRKLASRMLMVEENERRRISRELHDDAGQALVVIRLQMEMIELDLPAGGQERERLAEARDLTEKTILDIRRLISDLSPAVLEQLGLGAALRQLVNRFRARYPCRVRIHVGALPHLDTNFQSVIYRLAQECFNNISEHSEADAVNISVSAADRVLKLQVEDNGRGFHVEEALNRKDCFGLIGIQERVTIIGGRVSITSTRKEGQKIGVRKKSGTVIKIELPIP